ncbi:CHASE2 domain-containing protein [Phormidesmis sp. 146-12]
MFSQFSLKVQQIEQICTFELSWGQGQQLTAKLAFPATLRSLYQTWQTTYHNFYSSKTRARPGNTGVGVLPPTDWRTRLVQAEAALLAEFYYWLSSADLLQIRSTIARAASQTTPSDHAFVDLFLTCEPLELARLPWEAWEIGVEFGTTKPIRIARTPMNRLHPPTVQTQPRRMRVLAIMGDETGLDFKSERDAIKALSPDVQFVGWQAGRSTTHLKSEIYDAIAAPQGWDVLFFAGHSNETILTGGELMIAPNESILVTELIPALTIAKEQGLQFAIFNSCKGMNIAETLISLGLNEVAVMREPIHNSVAKEFLIQLIQRLANYHDAHSSLLSACGYLKAKKNLTYPSAYLIPSLFRYPDISSFQLREFGWKQRFKQCLPSRRETIVLSACLLLSVIPQVQSFLLDRRLLIQSLYREVSIQTPVTKSPVTLIQIDEDSIRERGISSPKPMDRKYLAEIVDRLTQRGATIIGVDYFLDRQQPINDPSLAASVRKAVSNNATWFVFGAYFDEGGKQVGVLPVTQIARRSWSIQGYTNAPQWYTALPSKGSDCIDCPFSYLLAMSYLLRQNADSPKPNPLIQPEEEFQKQILDYARTQKDTPGIAFLKSVHKHPITEVSRVFGQRWGQPVLDFSIPPDRIYQSIPAWQLFDPEKAALIKDLSQQIVIIAPGGYGEAGIDLANNRFTDTFDVPAAIAHYRDAPSYFTGGEALSYMVHHFLSQRLVIPIPDLWMVIVAAIAAKGLSLSSWKRKYYILAASTAIYSSLSLQLFISAAIVLPILLPSAIAWLFFLPFQRKQHD